MNKGVIVEFDFTVTNGAGILFETARSYLDQLDKIPFDAPVEARYFAGRNALEGFTEYFGVVKTKKTPAKACKDIDEHFRAAIESATSSAVTDDFRAYVSALVARDVRVTILTHADIETVKPNFEDMLGDKVMLYHEESFVYGSLKWDGWRRACAMTKLSRPATLAVAGSGFSVRSALVGGFGSLAVVNQHVAYQDFGGASDVVEVLDAAAAKKTLEILHL